MSDRARNPDRAEADEKIDSSISRRQYLYAGAGIVAGIGALSGTAMGTTERYGIRFDRVVNAVNDLGMDPTGATPIDNALDRTLSQGNTLVEFPPGEYYVRNPVTTGSVTNWGMRGLGDTPSDVRFVTTPGKGIRILKIGGGTGILVENVTLDYSQQKEGHLGLMLKANDNLRVQDVHFVGFNPTQGDGAVVNLCPQILDSAGVGVVDGIERKGPTDIVPHRHLTDDANAPGIIWMGAKHRGRLYIRNSHFENAGENGIYASAPPGELRLENCRFVNNNQAAVRLGGAGSYIRDTDFIVDADEAKKTNPNPLINPNGIVWETDKRGETGGDISGCNFVYESVPKKVTALWVDGSAGALSIHDCRFRLNADDVRPIRIDDPVESARLGVTASRPWGATLENVSITGESLGSDAMVELYRRPGSTIRNCCIQTNAGRDGIGVYDSNNCSVEDTTINVQGESVVSSNSGVATSNLQFEGSCPLPVLSDESTADSTDESTTDSKTLVVHGSGDGRSDYRIRYDGTAATDGKGDTAQNGVIEGSVWGSNTDVYTLDGTITEIVDLTNGATVTLDGEPVTTQPEPKTLVVHGSGDGRSDYRIHYDGTASTDGKGDTAQNGVIEGSVWGSNTDVYTLDGTITEIVDLTNGATVSLDGEPVTTQPEPKTLVVHGSGDGRSDYRIRYDGAASTEGAGDTAQDGVIEGSVWGSHTDEYQLEGTLVEIVDLTDGATVTLDGEPVDYTPEPKTLVVHGSGDGRSDYRIRYDGTASTDGKGDTAQDGVIEGSVWGSNADEYTLDGTLSEVVELNGATVTLDGKRIE